jgi:hypothetical protein
MILSLYVKCPNCLTVIDNSDLGLTEVDKPAPCCGATGEARIHWPSIKSLKFLEIVVGQNLESQDERRVAIVLLSTMLETLLEDIIWELLGTHAKIQLLKDITLDQNRGRERRIQLYDKLSDVSLKTLSSTNGLATFLDDWNLLSDLRNGIVHGQYYKGVKNEIDIIKRLKKDCLEAFKIIHSDVQRTLQTKVT